ncbi:ribose-phosphate pyrophosphokinase [[Mycoplasma] collis]|uniref:ribose-phosphate pyrophosphokinase n=1 Tax=[Mycoplasma] collis TaxID=2127 RepID=UPI00051BB687|nr:ribose-phosphate pyrophosphokinase [[Mycoplasma] collis]
MNYRNVIFGMRNAIEMAKKISNETNIPLLKVNRDVFADGETLLWSEETVRNSNAFIIASTHTPANENIMELLIFIDSLKRANVKSINIVMLYYGYARQDRKDHGRKPITAKLVADLLEKAGANRIIAIDLHNPSIQGFFNIPVDDLKGQYVLAKKIKQESERFTVVSPDHGGAVRARILSELIADTIKIAIIDKRRIGVNKTEVLGIIGNVKDKNVVIIDDIIDTGGTIIKAAKTVKEHGAKKVIIAATHGVFSNGFQMFEDAKEVDKVIITDTITHNHFDASKYKKLEIVSLFKFISKTINAITNNTSITEIYSEFKNEII